MKKLQGPEPTTSTSTALKDIGLKPSTAHLFQGFGRKNPALEALEHSDRPLYIPVIGSGRRVHSLPRYGRGKAGNRKRRRRIPGRASSIKGFFSDRRTSFD
jgi:hypothetical protein